MKAFVTPTYGPDARFEPATLDTPTPGDGQVLIEVRATSLNPIDNKMLRDPSVGLNPELPAVLHGDVAGVVTAVGDDVDAFEVGDAVYGCAGGFQGTAGALAEFMPADARLIAKKPTTIGFAEAAALPLVALTAWESLVDSVDVTQGERALVHGGAGGVGHVAVQIAKARGARVATTVSTEAKAQAARRLGADEVVNYREEPVDAYVERLTGGDGFDVVYDTVSGDVFEQSLQAVRLRGRVATVFTGTDPTKLDLMTAFLKAASVHAQNMSIPLATGIGRAHHGDILAEVAALVDDGRLTPLLHDERFSIDAANEAHALYESGDYVGKIVLEA